MRSNRAKIIDVMVRDLSAIKQGNKVATHPQNSATTFNSSVKKVFKSLSIPAADELPALLVFNSVENPRHLLADVTVEVMTAYILGHVHSFDDSKKVTAQDLMSDLEDDVRVVLSANPKFDNLARRSRILRSDHDTEVVEPDATFLITMEIDYIEAPEYGDDPSQIALLPIGCDLPQAERIMNGFSNALASLPGVATVQEADVWPIPKEQIQRRECPAFVFQATEETYEYHGSTDTTKRIFVSLVLFAVELDPLIYPSAIDSWVAKVKNVLGDNADLGFLVNTIDIRSIRASQSEYPVIMIEAELTIRYMQSFLRS